MLKGSNTQYKQKEKELARFKVKCRDLESRQMEITSKRSLSTQRSEYQSVGAFGNRGRLQASTILPPLDISGPTSVQTS